MVNSRQNREIISDTLTVLLEHPFAGISMQRNANNFFAHNLFHNNRAFSIHRKADNGVNATFNIVEHLVHIIISINFDAH